MMSELKPSRYDYCRNGHEYTEENSYMNPHNAGRVCRTCQRNRQNAYNALRRGRRANPPPKVTYEIPKKASKTRTHSGSGVIAGRITHGRGSVWGASIV
jgi:hypothetical protein